MQFNLSLSGSDILYYFAPLQAAVKIIESGKIMLSTNAASSDAAHGAQKPYFLSMTRSRQGRYHRNEARGVLFELDGRALGAKHKIRPVDYWQFNSSPRTRHDSNEMEERLYSDSPTLNIDGIVRSMSVLVNDSGMTLEDIGTLTVTAMKEHGVRATFYNDANAWKLGNKRKAISPADVPRATKRRKTYNSWDFKSGAKNTLLTDMMVILKTLRTKPDFDMYNDLYDLKMISSRHRGYITSYHRDLYSQLGAEFQNASRAHTMGRDKERQQLNRLLAEMKHFKITTPKQLADLLIAKYEEGRQAENARRKASEPQTNDEW